MEMEEEQKPKDLFEKEIKEEPLLPAESVYFPQFPQNISEDRITSFSPQYISELNDFATEVSHECQSLSSNQFEKEIKPEAESLLEKVKEEPLDEDDFKKEVSNSRDDPWLFLFDMPNDEISNSSSQIIKQEPICSEPRSVVSMDDVKMEPIDDFMDDLNSQMRLNQKVMKKPIQRVDNRRCSVCSQMKNRKLLKNVKLKQDKLIIAIKLVLRDEYNLAKAQSFMSETMMYICYGHFSKALKEICSALCIQKLEELRSCSSQLMQNLMVTVNHLLPQTSALDFCDILYLFATRNQHILPMSLLNMKLEEQESQNLIINESRNCNKTNYMRQCSVCSQMKLRLELRAVTSGENKIILMIGCLLRGEYTIEEAHSSMFKKKAPLICYDHFLEAINEIFDVLRIEKREEIYSCSTELMQNLMVTVNAVCPQLTTSDFRKNLNDFIGRNLNSFPMVHLERKHGDEKLLYHTSKESKNRSEKGTSQKHYCSVCDQKKPTNKFRKVKSVERKMIIMIGYILRGEYTIEEAHAFIYETNECFVCRCHFFQAINEIYKALKIKNYGEFAKCSAEKMNNLMIIVNDLIPQYEAWQFQNFLRHVLKSEETLFE